MASGIRGTLEARAAPHAYIFLVGPFFVLFVFFAYLEFARPASNAWQGAAFGLVFCLFWVIWLRGFRLTLTKDLLTYRDGFYRTKSVDPSRIIAVEHDWIRRKILLRAIPTPRVFVITDDDSGPPLMINPKPFNRAAFRKLQKALTPPPDRTPPPGG